jgi:DNA adenine methylase
MAAAYPIVKWAGGKTRLLPALRRLIPAKIATYVEPFAGGAALFYELANEGLFERAILADRNADLVACYRAVRDDVERLIVALGAYKYDKDLFYEVRDRDPSKLDDFERGARFLFLNRTCFNGLWRVNASGKFNVPFGRYKNPRIIDHAGLRAASAALAKAEVRNADFADVVRKLRPGDFAYFDPPYVPISKTSDFTAYAEGGFGPEDQERLVATFRELEARGVPAMISNADTDETRALYKGFAVHQVEAPRTINADPSKRGFTTELIVLNFGKRGFHPVRKPRRAKK